MNIVGTYICVCISTDEEFVITALSYPMQMLLLLRQCILSIQSHCKSEVDLVVINGFNLNS